MVEKRIGVLLDKIEREGKSIKWRMRAKAGTSVKWYEDAEDVENRAAI
jgi:hypothetical protein